MQGQLLETLVSVESRNSGGSTGNRPDIRIILTTEADLTAKVEAGSFSRDLFDRLTVFRLTLPPFGSARTTSIP
jgi:DNA-binding NtrC family response regulator